MRRISCAQDFPNILVLSAGGYGHVPIPLLKWIPEAPAKRPVVLRKHLVSFVGDTMHGPGKPTLRNRMKALVWEAAAKHNFSALIYSGSDWTKVMAESRTSLVPRGNGRTSFHLAETLHMGLVPIYVYSDTPWLPYRAERFSDVGFSIALAELPALLQRLHRGEITTTQLEAMEARHYVQNATPGSGNAAASMAIHRSPNSPSQLRAALRTAEDRP